MSSITSFLSNGRYIYQKWTESPSGIADTSCSAGGSGIANASNYSWVSCGSACSSGAAYTSAVSGGSGYYEQIGTAENLNVEQLIELFTKGNMIASEAEKMLQAHKNEITNVNAYKSGNMIRYTFRYNNTNYSIACSNDAAASQLDYKEQQLFTKSQLKYSYGINDENINKYFSVAFSDGSNLQFAFNPDYGFKSIYDVFAQIQSDNTKNASGVLNNSGYAYAADSSGASGTYGSSGSMNVNSSSGASGSGYVSGYYTNNYVNSSSGTTGNSRSKAITNASTVADVNNSSEAFGSDSVNGSSNSSNVNGASETSSVVGPNNGNYMTVRDVEKKISQILDEVKDAKITPEQAVRKLRLYGITVMSDIDDGTTVYLFTYNKKEYMFYSPVKNEPEMIELQEKPDITDGCRRGNFWDDEEDSITKDGKSAKANKDYDAQNNYIFPANGIYSVNDLKNTYKLSDEQINLFFEKNGEEYTIKSNLTWNGEKINDFSTLFMNMDKEYSEISASLEGQNFSKEFITYLIKYVKENTSIQESDGEQIDAAKIVEKYKNAVSELTSGTNLYFKRPDKNIMSKDGKNNIFEQNVSYKNIVSWLEKMQLSSNSQVQLFASMFLDTFDNLEFNDKEKEYFMSKVFKNISEKLGQKNTGCLTLNDISKLNANNGCWLDELYNIIHEEASQIKIVNRNPSVVDTDALFGDKEVLTATDIFNYNYDETKILSDDGGVRKFYEMIDVLLSKIPIAISSNFDRIELIQCLIKLINKEFGSSSKTLTKESLEKLNQQGDIFAKLENIINDKEILNLYYFGVDGEIDPFGQGGTGDCWLVASIISISATNPELIEKAITQESDGTIHITFTGVGITYDISPEEIVEAQEGHYYYSHGDNDVLAIELAVEKLFRDIDNGLYSELGISSTHNEEHMWEKSGLLWNNMPDILPYLLTGKRAVQCSKNDLEKMVSDFNSGDIIVSLSISPGSEATTYDGNEFSFGDDYGNSHAFAVVGMTENTITIVNPWDSRKEYTFSWEEFKKLKCSADINYVYENDEQYVHKIFSNVINNKLSVSSLDNLNKNGLVYNFNREEGDNYTGDIVTFDYNGQHYEVRENRYTAGDLLFSAEDLDKYFESSSLTAEEKQRIIDLCFVPKCIIDGNTSHYQIRTDINLEDFQQIIQAAQSQKVKDNLDIIEKEGVDSILKMCAKNHTEMLTGINILLMSDKVQNIQYTNSQDIEELSFEYDGITYTLTILKEKAINTDITYTYDELMKYFENTNLSEFDAYCLMLEYFENIGSRSDYHTVGYIMKGFIFALKEDKTMEDFLNAINNA